MAHTPFLSQLGKGVQTKYEDASQSKSLTPKDLKTFRRIADLLERQGKLLEALAFGERVFVHTKDPSDAIRLLTLSFGTFKAANNRTSAIFSAEKEKYSQIIGLKNLISEWESMNDLIKLMRMHRGQPIKQMQRADSGNEIVCFLHNSFPYSNGGYATRADGILQSLSKLGNKIHAYTRPGYPEIDANNGFTMKGCYEAIDNENSLIDYKRIDSNCKRGKWEYRYMLSSYFKYLEILKRHKPNLVLGRSTYLVSFPASLASMALGIPFFYEVSGLWEVVHQSKESKDFSLINRIKELETATCKNSHHIFTMTNAMKTEIISRNIPEISISLIPNCASNTSPATTLKIMSAREPKVFNYGYIGSFQFYEGIEDLVDALEMLSLNDCQKTYNLYLVGDGPWMPSIRTKISNSLVAERIILTGRVSKNRVWDYYSKLDLCIYPRIPLPVTEMVSPVKPLEAMHFGVPTLMSDVSALKEISLDGEIAMLFEKGSIPDLAKKMLYASQNPKILDQIKSKAQKWVATHRTWDHVVHEMHNQLHLKKNPPFGLI